MLQYSHGITMYLFGFFVHGISMYVCVCVCACVCALEGIKNQWHDMV